MENDTSRNINLLGERKYSFASPLLNRKEDDLIFQEDLIQLFPSTKLHRLENICLSYEGILFRGFNVLPISLIWKHQKKHFNLYYVLKQYFFHNRKKIREEILVCFDNWSVGYYHWMCDYLPRYIMCKGYVPKNIKVLLPNDFKREYIVKTLEIFGEHEVLFVDKKEYLSIGKIIVPDRPSPSGRVDKLLIQKVRQGILEYLNLQNTTPYRKVYISRAKATRRKLANNEEIENIFIKHGYEIICFEDYSFEEQVRIVVSSRIMAGLHGANLVNALFMEKGTHLFEFRLKEYGGNIYFNLGTTLDLQYHYCISSTEADVLENISIDAIEVEEIIMRDELY